MSLIPADLVTDLDLLALDAGAVKEFTPRVMVEKRRIAVGDWLREQLEQNNFPPTRHMVRREPDAVFGQNGSSFLDFTTSVRTQLPEFDVNTLLTPGQKVYIGMKAPFRGLFVGITDAPNSAVSALTVSYWNGTWKAMDASNSFVDGTQANSKTFSRAGRVLWSLPDDWFTRPLNNSFIYWVQLSVTNTLAPGTLVGQVLPLARSRFTVPAGNYALYLACRDSIGNTRGNWKERAEAFQKDAQSGLQAALLHCQDEFDMDDSNAVAFGEANSALAQTPWSWERG